MKRLALQNERVGVLGTAFRARKVFGTFEKRVTGVFFRGNVRTGNENEYEFAHAD